MQYFNPVLLVLAFTAIAFLQSGLDKIIDWSGNLGWLKEHFSKTIFKGSVPLLLAVLLVFELASGAIAVGGMIQLLAFGAESWARAALFLAAITLLMLFLGQRIAKDYAGAFTLTGYFLIILFGLTLLVYH